MGLLINDSSFRGNGGRSITRSPLPLGDPHDQRQQPVPHPVLQSAHPLFGGIHARFDARKAIFQRTEPSFARPAIRE